MERKSFTAPIEVKSLDEGGIFEGYASVYGVQDYDGDVIVSGAFKASIERYNATGRRPKMLWQHNPSMIIGKWLETREDERGLYVKGSLILEVEKGREAYALLKAGELDAMSVGFNIETATAGSGTGRVIDEADLWEISLVTWGANPQALISNVKSIRDFEAFLRDSGFSRKQAVAIAARGYNTLTEQSESDSLPVDDLKTLINSFRGA